MIKLFRNIRKKLLQEGKTANYFKYAIGEIVLVVIEKPLYVPLGLPAAGRDKIWVATNKDELKPRAFRYDI